MGRSPYDDGWLSGLELRVVEHAINHPATESVAAQRELRVVAIESDHDVDERSTARIRSFLAADRKR